MTIAACPVTEAACQRRHLAMERLERPSRLHSPIALKPYRECPALDKPCPHGCWARGFVPCALPDHRAAQAEADAIERLHGAWPDVYARREG
jgi:hypothetical protein